MDPLFDYANASEKTLVELISNQIQEGVRIEYKGLDLSKGWDLEITDKIMRTIVSFANEQGGFFIIGIKEKDHLPYEIVSTGLTPNSFSKWKDTLYQKISSLIEPYLSGVECKLIPINGNKSAVVIKVNRSIMKPHAIRNNDSYRFPTRRGSISDYMDIEEVRRQIIHGEYYSTKARDFLKNRIETLRESSYGYPFFTFHILPVQSFQPSYYIDIMDDSFRKKLRLTSHTHSSFNSNGYSVYMQNESEWMQIFHNGSIEYVYRRIVDVDKRPASNFNWSKAEKRVYDNMSKLSRTLSEKMDKPWIMQAHLINCRGRREKGLRISNNGLIDSDYVCSVESVWHQNMSFDEVIQPIFNSIANSFGRKKSEFIENEID